MFPRFRKEKSRPQSEDLVDLQWTAAEDEVSEPPTTPSEDQDSDGGSTASSGWLALQDSDNRVEAPGSDAIEEVSPEPAAPDSASLSSAQEENADADQRADAARSESVEAELSAPPEEPADEASPPPEPAVWRPPQLAPPAGRKRRNAAYHLKASEIARGSYTLQQRILLLDTWQRSGLPAKDFADLVGVSKHTLYKWKGLFEKHGPEGLMDQRRGPQRGSRLSEVTKRAILMLKSAHPEWGCDRISDTLARGPALAASASAVARLLKESGYQRDDRPIVSHNRPKVRTFERARPNQLWQTDLFTFVLKRQNRRLYLVAFMDDYSRFIVSYGLHASASTALVLDVLEAGIANHGLPEEILTDNGPQYVTWRGKSRFTRHLEKRGIRQIVARPKRPQTLGKIERFWGTLWRELIEGSVFADLADGRTRVGHYLDYYNFLRTHTGIGGLVPADRFFGAAEPTRLVLKERVAANALELARSGPSKTPFYLSGNVSGRPFSVHAEGERLVLKRQGEARREIELAGPPAESEAVELPPPVCPHAAPGSVEDEASRSDPLPPGQSVIDELSADEQQQQGGA